MRVVAASVQDATRSHKDGVSGPGCELHDARATKRRDALRGELIHVLAGAQLPGRPGPAREDVPTRLQQERVLSSCGDTNEASERGLGLG